MGRIPKSGRVWPKLCHRQPRGINPGSKSKCQHNALAIGPTQLTGRTSGRSCGMQVLRHHRGSPAPGGSTNTPQKATQPTSEGRFTQRQRDAGAGQSLARHPEPSNHAPVRTRSPYLAIYPLHRVDYSSMMHNPQAPFWRSPMPTSCWNAQTSPYGSCRSYPDHAQVGKTTMVLQVLERCGRPHHYGTADSPVLQTSVWISQQWNQARALSRESGGAVLVLDEIQKVEGWPEAVKLLWDEDTRNGSELHVILMGSSPCWSTRDSPRAWRAASRCCGCRTGASGKCGTLLAGT